MPFSTAIDNKVLDHFTRKADWALEADFFVGLSSTTPTKAGGNVTEPSGGAYARVQITAAQFNAASASATTTNVEKSFPTATATWLSGANLTHLVIYDAASAGNFLGFKALDVAKPVISGDTAKIAAGDLDIAMGGV